MEDDQASILDYAQPPGPNVFARCAKALLIVSVLAFAFIIVIWSGSSISTRIAKACIRSESIRLLSGAPDLEARKRMVKEGGWVSLDDGSWIVIRYSCAHCSSGGDTAIALDSTGRWYESSRHFCGSLGGIDRESLLQRGLLETPTTQAAAPPPGIEAIALCPDLGAARALLLSEGFKPLSVPSPFEVSH